MNQLLANITDVHGGIDIWNYFEKLEATIVSGGGLFPLKGLVQDSKPRRMTVWLHEEHASNGGNSKAVRALRKLTPKRCAHQHDVGGRSLGITSAA